MTPAARIQAAIEVLDAFAAGEAAERALTNWARANRFAGSGDRAALRDLVYGALRRRRSLSVRGGGQTGRALMIGAVAERGDDLDAVFSGLGHAPAALSADERARLGTPSARDLLDLPDWLIAPLCAALGPDLPAVAEALRHRAPLFLRVNAAKGDTATAVAALASEGVAAVPVAEVTNALLVTGGERKLAASRAYLGGLVEVQDLSSQAAVAALPDPAGLRVLDYCAGGGGKSLALAARGARVSAHDISAARLAALPPRAARAGARIATLPPGSVRGSFDLVVVDAPCSGSGTWRRTPEAKWRLTPDRLAELTALQARVLDAAARHAAPSARLAYMTCSLLEAENGDQIADFHRRNPGWTTLSERRFSPLDLGGDGFFLALVQHK